MQAYAETASKAVAEAEAALRISLEQKDPNYAGFEPLLEKLRLTSQDFVFLTFATPAAKTAEDRLWDGHVKVNKKFQKHLKQFRDGAGRKKHVERRKAEKHYLHFIKSSMHFYRGFIQSLASHFANVSEIKSIAAQLHLDTLSIDPLVNVNLEQQAVLYNSCHNALMRLGDLSRYRETELEQKDRNWGPAKGHYLLALSLKPESGAAYNQLAVMALADEDHLRAVYHLHRAAAAGKPFPVARDNIKLEFEKLLKFEPEDKPAISDTSKQTLEVLENRFLAFHANCHRQPTEFLTFTEKAIQILQLVTLGFEEIKDRSLDKFVQKMCLINISAEHLAWQGITSNNQTAPMNLEKQNDTKVRDEHERNCQSVFLLQRFNILTFTTLLKVLARELVSESEPSSSGSDLESSSVPPAVRRLLPHLRQYSSWLLSNIHGLLSPRHPSTQTSCLDQFWKTYVKATNLLLSRYSIGEISDLDHLLEEDENTLSFAPFSEKVSKWRYHLDNGPRKSVLSSSLERPYEDEMLARIRRFVFDAATISNQKDALEIQWAPIAFNGGEFNLQEKPVKVVEIVKPKTPSQPFRIRAHAYNNSLNGVSPAQSPKPEQQVEGAANKARERVPLASSDVAVELDSSVMENMVSDLIDDKPDLKAPVAHQKSTQISSSDFRTSSMLAGTEISSSNPINIMDIVRNMQQKLTETPTPSFLNHNPHHSSNPSISGIWNTAFTPKLGPNASTSRPGTASGASSSSQLQRSSALFQQELLQQEREIQLRTSPQVSTEYSSWAAPPDASPMQVQHGWPSNSRSPWHSPSARSPSQQDRPLPQTALFGAIGEPRKHDPRTPTSGQSS